VIETRRLIVTGRVQGVGYRYWMMRTARKLGLGGWVRNRSDGSVEAMVQGTPAAVAQISALARCGPEAARVTQVQSEPADGEFAGFETRATL
jgi:acylphosphatase